MVTAAPASSTGSGRGLYQFHQRVVSVTYREGKEEKTVEGTVVTCSAAGIVVKARGITTLISANSIVGEPQIIVVRRKRVQRRHVRIYSGDDSVKQHLADRHGILVSLLDAVDEATAHRMHDNIVHDDLGHSHVEKTSGRTVVNITEAASLMAKLGEPASDDDEDDEDYEEDGEGVE